MLELVWNLFLVEAIFALSAVFYLMTKSWAKTVRKQEAMQVSMADMAGRIIKLENEVRKLCSKS